MSNAKFQLNSGQIPEHVYKFYRDLATFRGTHIATGVAEALEIALPAMAEKYHCCPSCQRPLQSEYRFCPYCGHLLLRSLSNVEQKSLLVQEAL